MESDLSSDNSGVPGPEPENPGGLDLHDLEAIIHRQNTIAQLEKAVSKMIASIKNQSAIGELNTVDMLRVRVLLTILIACGYTNENDKDSPQSGRLLEVNAKDDTWHRMIGRVLFSLFGGKQPTILSLKVDESYDDIPEDLLECWASCYWAAASVIVLVSRNKSLEKIEPSFVKMMARIQQYTAAGVSEASTSDMQSVIRKMSERFGRKLSIDQADIDSAILSVALPESLPSSQ